MRPRVLRVTGAVALCGLVFGEPAPAPHPPAPSPSGQPSPARVPPDPVDSDLEAIRDIFRFGDEVESGRRTAIASPDRPEVTPSVPPPAPGARLIGLVRRPDGLRAALALEGEVVLLGPEDSALGYTVLGVSEEKVTLRDPGGEEITLSVGPG